jgi:lipoprotein-anchoring transpeptidase ErfK/SrfK
MAVAVLRCFAVLAPFALVAACSEPADPPTAPKPPPPLTPVAAPAPLPAPTLPPQAQAINVAQFAAPAPAGPGAPKAPAAPPAYDPVLVKVQVLLDRARFSPGVIDGRNGDNVHQAVAAFETAKGLPADGQLDEAFWSALTGADAAPVVQTYVIAPEDVAGPFLGERPDDYDAMAKLPALGYERASEGLAEKFHMDEDLLLALNPGVEFAAGTAIVVAAPGSDDLGVEVASIEVDKAARALRAFDAQGRLVALYPASVGSTDMPAPSGTWAVRAVAPDPVYYYDPSRLSFGRTKAAGKLEIKAGPNNPVGGTWIDLTRDTYGIHGSPDPETIGKQQSHGCVRLTNWDAAELGKAVKAGTKVSFVGPTTAKPVRS